MRAKCNSIFIVLILLAGAVVAQEKSADRELRIAPPDDADIGDAQWKRLVDGYGAQKAEFMNLLLTLDSQKIDYTRDSFAEIGKKRQAISQALGQFSQKYGGGGSADPIRIDYSRVAWETAPRLTGRILRVGPNEEIKSLDAAIAKMQAGDQILLGAGEHALDLSKIAPVPNAAGQPGNALASDIAIVGEGATKTILKSSFSPTTGNVTRWRFTGLSIRGSSLAPLPGGSLEVDHCRVEEFQNAVFASGGVMLISDCVLGGRSRVGARLTFTPGGLVNAYYFRKCEFSNIRDFGASSRSSVVLDRCKISMQNRNVRFGGRIAGAQLAAAMAPRFMGTGVFIRETTGINSPNAKKFKIATDDTLGVAFLLGEKLEESDSRLEGLARDLKLGRNPVYWISLFRHSDDAIRQRSAKRLSELIELDVKAPAPAPAKQPNPRQADIEKAIKELDGDQFSTREAATATLLEIGAPAAPALQAILETGSLEQKKRADSLLKKLSSSLPMDPLPQEWEVEHGRLSRWYAENKTLLAWDEEKGVYRATTP